MRSTEERVAAVKRRAAQIERQKRLRRNRIAVLSSVAACLAVIVGVSFAMPGISEKLIIGDHSGYETAASIFSGSAAAGYIIIGLLSLKHRTVTHTPSTNAKSPMMIYPAAALPLKMPAAVSYPV